jgi:hypothetical protein
MRRTAKRIALCVCGLLVMLAAAWLLAAEENKAAYPKMAPLEQYMMERNAEIALARSAAPPAISDKAEVLVLEKRGYVSAVQGTNGFVCLVQRSWFSPADNDEFWNAKERSPGCFNAAAAKSYLRVLLKRTDLILAGMPKEQVVQAVGAAIDKKELSAAAPGAMCYMQSKQAYLSDSAGRWHPHLMFFVDQEPESWAANLPGSPVYAGKEPANRVTVFLIPVGKWSDGTSDEAGSQQAMAH